jgi:hypothetical protein
MEAHRVIVGACGWDHTGWLGRFYPEDLPEDWRLSYYANEFSGVLLPEPEWRGLDAVGCRAMCDEVAEGFRFYLEVPERADEAIDSMPLRQGFGDHWGGCSGGSVLVLDAAEPWDLRQLRGRIEGLLAGASADAVPALFLRGSPPDVERMRQARMLADML